MFSSFLSRRFAGKLSLLQLRVGLHAILFVTLRQIEHAQVQRMESRESYELKLVAHCPQLFLEARDRRLVQLLLPVERWRAVVGQHLARKFFVNSFGKAPRFFEVWLRSFAPDQVSIRRVRNCAGDG